MLRVDPETMGSDRLGVATDRPANEQAGVQVHGRRATRTFRGLVAVVATAMVLTAASVPSAGADPSDPVSPASFNGQIGNTGCTYAISASWTDPTMAEGNLGGNLTCGSRVAVTVTGSWDDSGVTVGIVSGSFDGVTLTLHHVDTMVDNDYNPTTELDAFVSDFADDALAQTQAAALTSPTTFGPVSFLDGACSYTISASWNVEPSNGGLDGYVTCGLKTNLDVTGSWDSTRTSTEITLDTLGGHLAGLELTSQTIGGTVRVPHSGTDNLDGLVDDFAQQLPGVVGGWFADIGLSELEGDLANPSGAAAAAADSPADTLSKLDAGCEKKPLYNDPQPDCGLTNIKQPEGTTANPDSEARPGLSKMDESQQGACPGLANNPPPNLFVVCVPTYLTGDFNAGSKTVMVVPGGAIVAAPIGSTVNAPTTPTIKTTGSILVLGGAIEGVNLSMTAKNIELAGSFVTMLGNLSLNASDTLEVGQVDVKEVLGFVPNVLTAVVESHFGDVGTGIDDVAGWGVSFIPGTMTVPAQLWASKITARAKTLKVGSGGSISTDGLGLGGAAFYGDPVADTGPYQGATAGGGGSYANYGGSHIGLGAWPGDYPVWADAMYGPGPRGATTDSPYKPSLPGGGGGGYNDASEGTPGGGVIEMSATDTMNIDGTVLADGDDGAAGPGGGMGAGGAINITTKKLTGAGSVHANGGGSAEDQGDLGGFGGGGAVAFHYSTSTFTGSAHAHGGLQQPTDRGVNPKDFGGAGTVFWEDKSAKPVPAGASGQTTPVTDTSGGTLVIDGDASEASRPLASSGPAWPTVDGTPIPESWSNKRVELDIMDGAHAYAKNPTFGKIVLGANTALSAAPSARKLVVTAGTINVSKTGRIDMSGHGFAGGTDGDGDKATAFSPPGTRPANYSNGGSHGGVGGINATTTVGKPGSTYDDPANPHLAGGGGGGGYGDNNNLGSFGGGILYVVAGYLALNGILSADGQDEDSPTLAFPRPEQTNGAATGAGGALQVHAQTLAGSGSIEAKGGGLNLPPSMGIGQPDAGGFTQVDGANGAGGGGDVLVVAPKHRSFTGHVSAAGGINYLWSTSNGHAGHVTGVGAKKHSRLPVWLAVLIR